MRVSKADPHYLAFDSGQGYFPIGHNLPIYHTSGQLGDEAMRKFAAAEENYNRWWMSASGFGIEWMDRLGWYRQDAAARIDVILDLAHELGLYYMMCMDTHQDFREQGWDRNPFNAKNGGPCKRRASGSPTRRPGSSTGSASATPSPVGATARTSCAGSSATSSRAGPIRPRDQAPLAPGDVRLSAGHRPVRAPDHHQLLGPHGPGGVLEAPNIDIVQTHCYTNDNGNVAEAVRRYSLHQWQRFAKPHIFGEFGIRSHRRRPTRTPGLGHPQRPLGRADQLLCRRADAVVARELHGQAGPLLPLHSLGQLHQGPAAGDRAVGAVGDGSCRSTSTRAASPRPATP